MLLLLLVVNLAAIPVVLLVVFKADKRTTSDTTVGVILTDGAAVYGWGTSGQTYDETTVDGYRVIVFDNLYPEARPDVALADVVGEMIERGARYLFISPHLTGVAETKLDEYFPNVVFILNLSTREDVKSLLSALATTKPDLDRIDTALAAESAREKEPVSRSGGISPGRVFVLCGFGVIAAFLITLGVLSRTAVRPITPDTASRSMIERLLTRVSEIERKDKPKKKRRGSDSSLHHRGLVIQDAAETRKTDFAAQGEENPLVYRITTYVAGDKRFDQSFPIETPSGEFLGEFGAGIAEKQAFKDPARIGAVEVWLFDKHDIRTSSGRLVSHTLMNEKYALKTDGSAVLAETDAGMALETKALRLRARVLDVAYGYDPALTENSFFDHLVIELAVWQKIS